MTWVHYCDSHTSRACHDRYLLYGHLGGVVYLATNNLGELLVSLGRDKVVKVWRPAPPSATPSGHNNNNSLPLLQPVR